MKCSSIGLILSLVLGMNYSIMAQEKKSANPKEKKQSVQAKSEKEAHPDDSKVDESKSEPKSGQQDQAQDMKKEAIPTDPGLLLEYLQEKINTIKTVQATFVQTKQLKLFDRQLVLKGSIALHKPDRMIWHVNEPVSYTMFLDKKHLRQWDEDTRQIQTIDIGNEPAAKEMIRQFNAWLLGEFTAIAKTYETRILQQVPLTLVFIPKPESPVGQVIVNVSMTMGDDLRYIQKLTIEEKTGDVTTVDFHQTRLNETIPDTTWELVPR